MADLMNALKIFAATEANLDKIDTIWIRMKGLIPTELSFRGDNTAYSNLRRSFAVISSALPKIDGWKPTAEPALDLNEITQNRIDAREVGVLSAEAGVEIWIHAPGSELQEYRFKLNQKRTVLVRDALIGLIDRFDIDLRTLQNEVSEQKVAGKVNNALIDELVSHLDSIEVLLGSSVQKPPRWSDLRRHLYFRCVGDIDDIEIADWPKVKDGLRQCLYGAAEPIPVEVDDLSNLVSAKPHGPITIQLKWAELNDEDFERLIFALICSEPGYENAEWLMKTRAPDRGRDLSVTRVITDGLAGTTRRRVVIQCKHWLSKSVTLPEISSAREQMTLWPDPRVDVLVLATSGRFTADAVQWVERYNSSAMSPSIEMWPESNLERILAARPALIAEFKLR